MARAAALACDDDMRARWLLPSLLLSAALLPACVAKKVMGVRIDLPRAMERVKAHRETLAQRAPAIEVLLACPTRVGGVNGDDGNLYKPLLVDDRLTPVDLENMFAVMYQRDHARLVYWYDNFADVLGLALERALAAHFVRATVRRVSLPPPEPGAAVVVTPALEFAQGVSKRAQMRLAGSNGVNVQAEVRHNIGGHLAWAVPLSLVSFPFGLMAASAILGNISAKRTAETMAESIEQAAWQFAAEAARVALATPPPPPPIAVAPPAPPPTATPAPAPGAALLDAAPKAKTKARTKVATDDAPPPLLDLPPPSRKRAKSPPASSAAK
jgi:hypothetical protein